MIQDSFFDQRIDKFTIFLIETTISRFLSPGHRNFIFHGQFLFALFLCHLQIHWYIHRARRVFHFHVQRVKSSIFQDHTTREVSIWIDAIDDFERFSRMQNLSNAGCYDGCHDLNRTHCLGGRNIDTTTTSSIKSKFSLALLAILIFWYDFPAGFISSYNTKCDETPPNPIFSSHWIFVVFYTTPHYSCTVLFGYCSFLFKCFCIIRMKMVFLCVYACVVYLRVGRKRFMSDM